MQAHCSQLLFYTNIVPSKVTPRQQASYLPPRAPQGKAQVDEKGQAVSGTLPSTTGGWAGSTKLHHSHIDTSKACISVSIGAKVQAHCSQLLFYTNIVPSKVTPRQQASYLPPRAPQGKAQVDEKGQAVSGTLPPLVEADRSRTGEQAT